MIDVDCRTYNVDGPVEEIKLVDDALNVVRVDVEDDEHLQLMVRVMMKVIMEVMMRVIMKVMMKVMRKVMTLSV